MLHNFINHPSPEKLVNNYLVEQQHILTRLGNTPLSEIPSLAAWRMAFRQFGVDPTKYRSAPEALLRRLTKKGNIPSINTLVDICNLVSIRYALPAAAFDTRTMSGVITVQYAAGEEIFIAHDSLEPEHPEPGEVIFKEPAGLVVARRWCWKQSMDSTVSLSTVSAMITIESLNPVDPLQNALDDIQELLELFLNPHLTCATVDMNTPSTTWVLDQGEETSPSF